MTSPALRLVLAEEAPPPQPRRPTLTLRSELQALGLGPKTVSIYYRRINDADQWCRARGSSLAKAPGPLVATYADTLPRGWSSRKELRSACKWYWIIVKRKDPPLTFIRVPPKPAMVCKAVDDHVAALLAKVASDEPYPRGLALSLGLYQAMRREEMATLPWDAFGPEKLRVIGKFEKERRIHIHPRVLAKIGSMERAGEYVFPGRFGGHVSTATIWYWIRTLGEEAGVHVTPHMLRHTCLATQHDNTGDLLAVMGFAGHSRPETTAGYTRTKDRAMYAAMMSVDYLGDRRSPARKQREAWSDQPGLFDDE